MILTRKALNRRTVLRGTGAVLALPLMDAMMPASSRAAEAADAARKRLHVIYTPNGMMMENWTPAQAGGGYTLTPILKPLEPYREKFSVISGLDHAQAEAMVAGAVAQGFRLRMIQAADD